MASPLAPSTLTLTTSAQPQPPGLQEATKNSTSAWQADLEALFRGAKERFPDVVWELVSEEEGEGLDEGDGDGGEGFGEEYGYGVGLGMGLGKMGGRASRMSATGTVAGKGQRDVEEVWGHKGVFLFFILFVLFLYLFFSFFSLFIFFVLLCHPNSFGDND